MHGLSFNDTHLVAKNSLKLNNTKNTFQLGSTLFYIIICN